MPMPAIPAKRYQLYSHYQDERAQPLGPEESYDTLVDAEKRAAYLGSSPIAYGTIEICDTHRNMMVGYSTRRSRNEEMLQGLPNYNPYRDPANEQAIRNALAAVAAEAEQDALFLQSVVPEVPLPDEVTKKCQ